MGAVSRLTGGEVVNLYIGRFGRPPKVRMEGQRLVVTENDAEDGRLSYSSEVGWSNQRCILVDFSGVGRLGRDLRCLPSLFK